MAEQKVAGRATKRSPKRFDFFARIDGVQEVAISGDFTNWTEEGIRLTQDAPGEWHALLSLIPGEYQYRLRVDGQWTDHPDAEKRVPNPFGTENCVLIVE